MSLPFVISQTDDGNAKIQCKLEGESIWLTQALMAELFDRNVRTFNEHLQNIYEEQELQPEATIRKFRIVQNEGSREVARQVDHYNLEAFLDFDDRPILKDAGRISAKLAKDFAESEFEKFRPIQDKTFLSDFDKEIAKQMERSKPNTHYSIGGDDE